MPYNTIGFHNRLLFPVKIVRKRDNVLLNFLYPNQRYVEKAEVGTDLSIRIAHGPETEVMSVQISTTFETISIDPSVLRSPASNGAGTAYISDDILFDLYRIEPNGDWTILDDFRNVNAKDGMQIGHVTEGMFFVATVPNKKEEILFLYLVTDSDVDGNYGNISGYSYAKGFTTGEGAHIFENRGNEHRLLPNGHLKLNEGEVVLYQSPNFNSKAEAEKDHFWIFSGSLNDFTHYVSEPARSCIPGPNTVVTLHSSPNMGGTETETDEALADTTILSFETEKAVDAGSVHIGVLNELSQEYDKSENEKTVYRTTLALNNPAIEEVYLEAGSENTVVEIEGTSYTLNPYKPDTPRGLRVPISSLRRVVIRQEPGANSLHIPELFVNTNTMRPEERVVVHRDAALHNKIATLKSDLKSNRSALGLETDTAKLPDSACDAAQTVLQSLAKTALTGYHQDTGIQSVRRYDGTAMEHSHWWLDNSGNHAVYQAMSPEEYAAQIADVVKGIDSDNIHDLDSEGSQSAWDWIQEGWDTVKHVGSEIADKVEKGVKATIVFVKDNVTHMYQFTLKAAEMIVGVMKAVLDAIKLAIEKLIEFLRFLFDLKKIKEVYEALYSKMDQSLKDGTTYIKEKLHDAQGEVKNRLNSIRNDILKPISGKSVTPNTAHPPTAPHHNEVVEKFEWILSIVMANPHEFSFSTPGEFDKKVQDRVVARLESAVQNEMEILTDFVRNPGHIGADVTAAMATIVETIIDGLIEIVDDGIALIQKEVGCLEQLTTSPWEIPVLSKILQFCGLNLPSPLQIVCMIYAVPVGVACALEDIDVDGLTLANERIGHLLAGVADILNANSSPITTASVSKGSSPLPPWAGVILGLGKIADATVAQVLEGPTAHTDWLKAALWARGIGGLIIALCTTKGAIINGILDILCGGVKLGIGASNMDAPNAGFLVAEGTGWILELTGFTKQPEFMIVGCLAESGFFGMASEHHFSAAL